jgi:hypothetical protein
MDQVALLDLTADLRGSRGDVRGAGQGGDLAAYRECGGYLGDGASPEDGEVSKRIICCTGSLQ